MSKVTGSWSRFERSAALFMAIAGAISFIAMIGLVIGQPILASLHPDYIPMPPATALIFLGLCGCWFLHRILPGRQGIRRIVQAGLVGMLIIVLILASRYFTGLGPDLERLLSPNPGPPGQFLTGRMSPLTALGFFLAIPAVVVLTGHQPGKGTKTAAASLSLVVFILNSINILGYLYGAPLFYGGTFIPVAITSALAFWFLSLGLLMCAGPACWPVSVFMGAALKARLLRAFIPASILIVLIQGFLSSGSQSWSINPAIMVAVATLVAWLIVIFVITLFANNLSADFERGKLAEEALRKSESSLQAVLRSTADGILAVGSKNDVLYANERFSEIWRIPQAVIASKDDSLLLQHVLDQLSDPQSFLKKVQELYKSKDESLDTLNFKDGRVFERLSRPLLQGEVIQGRVWSFRDVSERKQAEDALRQSELELRALFASMREVVLVIDRAGVYRKIAPTNQELLVSAPEQLLGKTLQDVFPPEQAGTYINVVQEVLETKQIMKIEYDLIIGARTVRFETSISPMTEDSTLWVAHDITGRKRNELIQDAIYRISQATLTSEGIDALYHSIHSILGELISAENFYIALYDPLTELISFPYYIDQFDEPPPAPTRLQGLTGYVIRSGRPLLAPPQVFDRLLQQGEIEVVGTTGEDWMGAPLIVESRMIGVMAVQSYSERIHFNQEDLKLLEFVSTQVAQAIERKRMEEEIRSLSMTDELTGLYNRRGFSLLAEQELKLAHRKKRRMLLFFGDVDDLKTINDTFGHAQGDLALKEVAAILKATFREADIPARIGGDEFVVLAVDASRESTEIITRRLQAALESRDQLGEQPYQLSLSLGIVHFDPEFPCSVSELIAQADAVMYQRKQTRKGKKL